MKKGALCLSVIFLLSMFIIPSIIASSASVDIVVDNQGLDQQVMSTDLNENNVSWSGAVYWLLLVLIIATIIYYLHKSRKQVSNKKKSKKKKGKRK